MGMLIDLAIVTCWANMLDRMKCDHSSHRDSIIAYGEKAQKLLVSLSGQLTAGLKRTQGKRKGKKREHRCVEIRKEALVLI